MHYKRRSRRKDKRHMAPCGCCEIYSSSHKDCKHHYIPNKSSTGKPRSKRKTPAKEKCPVAGTHLWVHQWDEEHGEKIFARRGFRDCEDCTPPQQITHGTIWTWTTWIDWDYCWRHKIVRPYVKRQKHSLCVECGKEKFGSAYYDDHQHYVAHPKPHYLRPWKPREAYRKTKPQGQG